MQLSARDCATLPRIEDWNRGYHGYRGYRLVLSAISAISAV